VTTTAIPPQHILDAEHALLGGVLLGGARVLRSIGLPPTAFYTEAHRLIYRAMQRLDARNEPVDIITVSDELTRINDLELAGGSAALARLMTEGAEAIHAPQYARIVAAHAQELEYQALAQRLLGADGREAKATIIDDAITRIRELAPRAAETIPSEATAFLAHRFPPRRDVVSHGVLPRAGLMIINGLPKVHKSMLADNLILARARGAPWLGFATDPGITLALQAEHSAESWQRRFTAMMAHDPEPLPADRLFLRTLRGVAINTPEGLSVVHRLLDETRADLLRIDPLARFMVGRENSNDADGMGGVVRAIDALLERGVSVQLEHHQGKPSRDDSRTGGLSLRGGSALFAAADAILTVERDGDAITVSFELRDAPPLAPMRLAVTPELWLAPAGPDPDLVALARLVIAAPLPYRTLVGAAQQDLRLSESSAKRRIRAALDAGLLQKNVDGLYGAGSRGHEGSNDA
jgi:hypothetical protein